MQLAVLAMLITLRVITRTNTILVWQSSESPVMVEKYLDLTRPMALSGNLVMLITVTVFSWEMSMFM